MIIKELHIKNYKSLVDLKIIEPNPFTVFAGSNGAGKSNIFEALEFLTFHYYMNHDFVMSLFGYIDIIPKMENDTPIHYSTMLKFKEIEIGIEKSWFLYNEIGEEIGAFGSWNIHNEDSLKNKINKGFLNKNPVLNHNEIHKQMIQNFSRVFINNSKLVKQNFIDDSKLSIDCSNLEKVLKRILKDKNKREDICEWLDLLVPGFEKIEIVSEPLSGTDSLIIYEKGTKKPYTKNLLSDGTYNILALLTAVYQSDEPQFLCIEEPENGLNPKVQKELVNLFRQKCEEEGHYIWINTHSQTIVNQLTNKELILVDKVDGATQIKQLTDFDNHGLPMDEAWLTNSLGGGIPW